MDSILGTLKNATEPIAIFGTKAMAQMVRKLLEAKKITFTYWCDNDPKIQNTILKGRQVLAPQSLRECCGDAAIIVCSFHAENILQIRKQLDALGFTKIIDGTLLYQAYVQQARGIAQTWVAGETLPGLFPSVGAALNKQAGNSKVFPSIGLLLTERCSLNCKNCTSLIPYFKQPVHYAAEAIVRSAARMLDAYTAIDELTLVGGEPLLHPDLLDICRQLRRYKIQKIAIITNGTIVPKDETLREIDGLGIYFQISDYGDIAHKEEFMAACDRNDVIYEILDQDITWYRIAPPEKHGRDKTENQRIYKNCIWNHCNTIQDGILTACPYIGSLKRLKPECVEPQNYIDLLDSSVKNEELFAFVQRMYQEQEGMPLCDYCSVNQAAAVPRAEQAKGKLTL